MLEMRYTNRNPRSQTHGLKFWLQLLAFPLIFGIIYVVSLILNSDPNILSKLIWLGAAILGLILFAYLATYFNHSRRWQEILFQADVIQIKFLPSNKIQTINQSEIRAIRLKTPPTGTSGQSIGFSNVDLKVVFDIVIKTDSKIYRISDVKCQNLPRNSHFTSIIDLYQFCEQNYQITPKTNIYKIDKVIERFGRDDTENLSETKILEQYVKGTSSPIINFIVVVLSVVIILAFLSLLIIFLSNTYVYIFHRDMGNLVFYDYLVFVGIVLFSFFITWYVNKRKIMNRKRDSVQLSDPTSGIPLNF